MKIVKSVFAVSVIAILAAGAANAEIVAKTQVDVTEDGTHVKKANKVNANLTALDKAVVAAKAAADKAQTTANSATTTANNAATKTELTNGLAQKQDANKRLTTQPTTQQLESTDLYPSVKVANDMIADANAEMIGSLNQEVADRKTADTNLQNQITANKGKIDTLNGDANTDGSVAKQINTAVTNINNNLTGNYATKAELATTNNNVTTAQSTANSAKTTAEAALPKASANVATGTYNHIAAGTDVKGNLVKLDTAVKAAANAAAAKVATAQGADNKDKALITNASGNVTTGTIATGMITNGAVTSAKIADGTIDNADIKDGTIAKGKLASAVQTSLGKADAALPQTNATVATGTYNHILAGADVKGNLVKLDTAVKAADTKAANAATAASTADGKAVAAQNTATSALNKANALETSKQDALTPGQYITITKDDTTGKTTIASTGPTYTLPTATADKLGGIKSGGDITVNATTQQVTVTHATKADSATSATSATNATKATNDSDGNKISTTYVKKAQGSTAASKAVITDSSGNVTTGTIATGMITNGAVTSAKIADGTIDNADIKDGTIAKGKLASAVQTSLGKADTAVQPAAIAKMENTDNKVAEQVTSDDLESTVKYPSVKAAQDMISTANAEMISSLEQEAADRATADADLQKQITAVKSTADGAASGKQPKSTAAYQMGAADGTWTTMSTAQQNALNSGITSGTKVTHTSGAAVGDSTHPVYVAANGSVTKIDKVANAAAADTATTATTATNALKIPYGSEGASTYVSVWVAE